MRFSDGLCRQYGFPVQQQTPCPALRKQTFSHFVLRGFPAVSLKNQTIRRCIGNKTVVRAFTEFPDTVFLFRATKRCSTIPDPKLMIFRGMMYFCQPQEAQIKAHPRDGMIQNGDLLKGIPVTAVRATIRENRHSYGDKFQAVSGRAFSVHQV